MKQDSNIEHLRFYFDSKRSQQLDFGSSFSRRRKIEKIGSYLETFSDDSLNLVYQNVYQLYKLTQEPVNERSQAFGSRNPFEDPWDKPIPSGYPSASSDRIEKIS